MSGSSVRVLLAVSVGLVLAACSPTADRRDIPPGTDRVVELTMAEMHFIPDHVTVKMGETVTFVVTNPNDVPHELFIGSMADQMAHRAMHQAAPPSGQAAVAHMGYGTYLEAHGTGMVTYHFATAGTVFLGCHLPGHWEAGMVATVYVER